MSYTFPDAANDFSHVSIGMDKGCADHIASGEVKVKGLTTIERLTADGVVLGDGTEVKADVILLACVATFRIEYLFSADSVHP